MKKQQMRSAEHRYLSEVDFSASQFKSAKLKDKDYTTNAPNFFVTFKIRNIGWAQFLAFVGR